MSDLTRGHSESEEIPPVIVESGFLRLPVDQEQFKDFIKGLLGRPQTISRQLTGSYEIGFDDIRNLDQLIWQRIAQQNGGALAYFKATLVYSDDSSVEVNSLPELLSYNEIRSVVCVSLTLRWDYLVQFSDKTTPEKQGIVVTYSAGQGEQLIDSGDDRIIHRMRIVSSGLIAYRIEHTARTWGADMDAMLHSFVKSQLKSENAITRWIRKYDAAIGLTVGISFFVMVAVGLFLTTRRFAGTQTAQLQSALANGLNPLDFIGPLLASGVWTQYSFAAVVFLVVSLFLSIWLGIWAGTTAGRSHPSFILLTKESGIARDKELAHRTRGWLSFCGSVVTALVLGVLSNYLFARFFSAVQ